MARQLFRNIRNLACMVGKMFGYVDENCQTGFMKGLDRPFP